MHSGQIGAGIARVAASVKSQANIVDAAARACSGIAESTRKIEQSAALGIEAAGNGGRAVQRSIEKITRGVQTARGLEERATRIEEMVALIGDVADQTELVSLNAAIEAARAGESGRGFTNVAQQVRKLADRSAKAAAEMTDLVEAVLESVRRIAADAAESLEAGGALKGDLERVTAALETIAGLIRTAATAAGKTGSSLAGALSISAEATKNTDALVAAHGSLQSIVGELDKGVRSLRQDGKPSITAAVSQG